jgi:serine/threonine protein phosphatase PrpC
MGQGLNKPVKSIVVKRHPGKLFRVGLAEMNGWRPAMEDAHIIFAQDTWGFFGVFDGHGGSQCSSFVAARMTEEIAKGAPEDDTAMRSLVLQLDREFLDTKQPSGSTGTFAIVRPDDSNRCFHLRIGNVGDSRVLLGRADGTMVEGSGTDGGLTTDHKPDHPLERARIDRTGGTVELVQGVARVNGDLAVSRAFGDEPHKRTGPSLEEQPVSADPEFTHITCDSTDFLMLVCDGISEGDFPNREVVKLAAEELRRGGESPDPGAAATAVCRMALDKGSMDNLSCMIVLFGGGEIPGPESTIIPDRFYKDANFREAYVAMSEHVGMSLAETLEVRYNLVKQQLADATKRGENGKEVQELQEEIAAFGDGPPADEPCGASSRIKFFNSWIQENSRDEEEHSFDMTSRDFLLDLARSRGLLPEPPETQAGRYVKVASADKVRAAFEESSILPAWSDATQEICGTEGFVFEGDEDLSNSTAEVVFEGRSPEPVLLPLSVLTDVMLEVCSLEKLRPAVEAHAHLRWNDRLESTCGQHGVLMKKDSDGTSNLRFPTLDDMQVWLPSDCLIQPEDTADGESAESARKRQRTEA